jgi:hypothetical protein
MFSRVDSAGMSGSTKITGTALHPAFVTSRQPGPQGPRQRKSLIASLARLAAAQFRRTPRHRRAQAPYGDHLRRDIGLI